MSTGEIEQLRRITEILRLGKVRRVERDRIVLVLGEIPTSPRHLHVHCAAPGLGAAPEVPIFAPGHITLQSMRVGLLPFASALIAFVEATRTSLDEKNRLCPPSRQPDVPLDWVRGTLRGMKADYAWSKEPDIAAWLDGSQLDLARGLRSRRDEPRIREASARYATSARAALANLARFAAGAA